VLTYRKLASSSPHPGRCKANRLRDLHQTAIKPKKRKEKKRKRNTRLKTKLQLICLSEAPDASSTVGANSIEITFVGSVGAISYSISHQRSADAAGLTAQAGEFRRQAIFVGAVGAVVDAVSDAFSRDAYGRVIFARHRSRRVANGRRL